jgi:DNA repair protein SbcD/Mre11
MKLLHTSDWHLGKRLFGLDRISEQSEFLNWLIELIKLQKIDHLLVAGDIFDVPQPPHKALKLFYDFISTLMQETSAELWIIAGNHDSGTLLDAPASLIDSKRVHLFGSLKDEAHEHWVKFEKGSVQIDLCLLPYFRHHELARWNTQKDVRSENLSVEVLKDFLTSYPKTSDSKKILMAHHLFGLYEAAGSEQALALSGVETIPLDWLRGFDYVALGHIHKPQYLSHSKPVVCYSGSPIPMRFSETKKKNVILLEVSDTLNHSPIEIPSFRDLHSIVVTPENWEEKLQEIINDKPLSPALELTLKLEAPITGLVESIRKKSDELNFNLLSFITEYHNDQRADQQDNWTELLKLNPEELFKAFYQHKYPNVEEIPVDLIEDMKHLWAEARHAPPSA